MKIDEFTIQKTFVEWARKQEFIVLCFAVPNGFASNSRAAMMMKKEGLLPGVPDVFCLLKNGVWAIIEFKTETGISFKSVYFCHNFLPNQIEIRGFDYGQQKLFD